MKWNRRDFVAASSMGLAGSLPGVRLLAQAAQQPPAVPEFKDVRRNVGVFTARGGTIGYLVTADAVIAIDSQFADTAPLFLEGLKTRTPRKIDLLINSHHHPDHTGGNKVMQPSVGTIVAHANVPGLQRKQAAAAKTEANQAYADTTFDKDWKTTVGKETVSARYFGPAHTGGDIVVLFENANVAHMGDLMFNRLHPVIDRANGASIANWTAVLQKVAAELPADTIYIFGHAGTGRDVTGSRADLLHHADYLAALLEHVRGQVKAGRTREEIVASQDVIKGFEDYGPLIPRPLGPAYDEVTAAQEQ
jgi:glyoxylase-like metal-dependent hydrolase (beta-lactamase superfamily II)